jgi:hypothetical protein
LRRKDTGGLQDAAIVDDDRVIVPQASGAFLQLLLTLPDALDDRAGRVRCEAGVA